MKLLMCACCLVIMSSPHAVKSNKQRGPYKKSYTKQQITSSLELFIKSQRASRKLTYKEAADHYGVPESTLRDYHRRYLAENASSPRYSNPATVMETVVSTTCAGTHLRVLPDDIEQKLKAWIDATGDITQPPSVTLICLKAKRLYFSLHSIPITEENCQEVASEKWWRGFKKRYGTLSTRRPRPIEFARARATQPEIINHFYDLLKYELETFGFTPDLIYAADETGVAGDLESGKVVGSKGGNTSMQFAWETVHVRGWYDFFIFHFHVFLRARKKAGKNNHLCAWTCINYAYL